MTIAEKLAIYGPKIWCPTCHKEVSPGEECAPAVQRPREKKVYGNIWGKK